MADKVDEEGWWEKYAKDPRTTEELIRIAIEDWDKEYDPDNWPSARTILHARGDQATFEAARQLAASPDARSRAVAATILGEFGFPERTMPDQCTKVLLEMLASETDPEVLGSICTAFHYQERTAEIINAVARFAKHPNEDVRFGVVNGLTWAQNDEAIVTLIELSRDPDEDIRDWATFGIGQIYDTSEEPERFDTLAIREALVARVDDEHWETRYEALSGLALRRDPRAVNHIAKMLAEEPPMFSDDLCEALMAMLEHYTGSREQLELALKECNRKDDEESPPVP
jgi:HEAT repeat protein